jgi:hypothetical protein
LDSSAEKYADGYELRANDGRAVARVTLGGMRELARFECAEGEWRVLKRVRRGWELIIEDYDGRQAGWYSGRHWLAGGTISLTTGTQMDLRKPLPGLWKLQTTETRDVITDMRVYGPSSARVMIRALPIGITEGHVAILTACAVVMLDRTLPVPGAGAGGGG